MIRKGDTFAGGDKMTRDIRVDRCITEKKAFCRLSGSEAHQMPSFPVLEPAANSSNRSVSVLSQMISGLGTRQCIISLLFRCCFF
ncbi:hypothetical protein NPIL_373921 [Nephila pilipes]|uniref:Uncharacterized protein n=1 Tax=Nephila pilipes TaxID=299642 RepID=A0A8X6P1T5_NEPPI|nr:hypothetical protein NPIL_373921 [Nephila pilipes]